MDHLPTLPRRSWTERVSLALACVLLVIGAAALAGWWFGLDFIVETLPHYSPIKANEALAFVLLGAVLLGRELGWDRSAWVAVAPALIGGLTVIEHLLDSNLGIDEALARDHLLIDTSMPGRTSVMAAGCVLLAAITLLWRVTNQGARARLFAEAVAGSLLSSVGFSTLLGYVASLPAVYNWGTNTATPPLTALALFLLGSALLVLAWRESVKNEGGPPAWAPMPAVIGCLTLTLILWIGLRERERAYLENRTQTAMDRVATEIHSAIDLQRTAFERMARDWSEGSADNHALWEAAAAQKFSDAQGESKDLGCVSIAFVDTAERTRWIYPDHGNEGALNFDHLSDPRRRDAIEEARSKGASAVSATTDIQGRKNAGFVIYAPILLAGRPSGYVAAEFLYQPLFESIIMRRIKISEDYTVVVSIGGETVFSTNPLGEPHNGALERDHVYPIYDRRIHLSLTPTDLALAQDRRFFPQLVLGAGFGITLLLGLSVHLGRRARAGQHLAELSNKRLIAENEERRRVEARLKVSDERLRLALDSTQIGIFEWNVPGGNVYYSAGLWALLGYEQTRMPSTLEAWQSLIHPDDLPLYRRRTESQLNGVATFIDPEYRVRSRSGDWRWVYVRSKSVLAGPNGRPTRIIGTVQDITPRREAEQALRESQAETRKLSLVASKTDNLVIIGSADYKIEWANSAFCRVMEYALEEVVGRSPSDLLSGAETDAHVNEQIRMELLRGQGMSTEIVYYSKSGRKFYVHLEVQAVRNQSGSVENFIAIATDITARVETENQLRRAKADADAASRAKSEFLASMSHEIRTPMNGVIGMTSLLMETTLTAEQRDFVNTIRTSGEALLTIINDILDFSKIESGKMELERLPFDLSLCLEEALDLFALQASSKNLELGYDLAPDVPAWIVGDVTRLRQVVVNLVNNAIKFTPSGSISVVGRRISTDNGRPLPANHVRLEFTVTDTGIGIPQDRIDRLFKAFSQVDSSTTRKYGGTGLGLAICQRLCQLMGGGIRADSKIGQGSVFTLNFVTEAAPRPVDAPAAYATAGAAAPLRNGLVMCLEQHPVTRSHIRGIIESLGATCAYATDIDSAVLMASALPVPPALVILPWSESDGAAILESLRRIACPRLILFPFGQLAPRAPGDDQPFGTVSKPIRTASLIHALATMANPGASGGAAEAAKSQNRLLAEEFPLNVLLAEDNPVNQKVAKRFLERLGYQADAVGNGLEAVNALENRHYDLVLMDLQMPEMDGLEASRQIRSRLPADRQPKIIALTANAMQGDREICLAAGMDDYISKPVKMPEIAAAIQRQFGKRAPATSHPFV